jgi:hypothetical protein
VQKFAVILLMAVLLPPALRATSIAAPGQSSDLDDRRIPLLMLDADYEWRDQGREDGWHGGSALLRLPLGAAFTHDPGMRPWQLGLRGVFAQGYGRNPNPQRAGVSAVIGWGLDWYTGGPEMGGISLGEGEFPLARSTLFVAGLLLEAGFTHSRGTQDAGRLRGPDTQDAIRIGHQAFFGFGPVLVRANAGVEFGVRSGPLVQWEAGIRLELGRPFLPFGLFVGFSYYGFERAGGGALVVGVTIAL